MTNSGTIQSLGALLLASVANSVPGCLAQICFSHTGF